MNLSAPTRTRLIWIALSVVFLIAAAAFGLR